MITKPMGLTPDNGAAHLVGDRLQLSAQVLNNSRIATFTDANGKERAQATLFLKQGTRQYMFPFWNLGGYETNSTNAPSVTKGDMATTVQFDLYAGSASTSATSFFDTRNSSSGWKNMKIKNGQSNDYASIPVDNPTRENGLYVGKVKTDFAIASVAGSSRYSHKGMASYGSKVSDDSNEVFFELPNCSIRNLLYCQNKSVRQANSIYLDADDMGSVSSQSTLYLSMELKPRYDVYSCQYGDYHEHDSCPIIKSGGGVSLMNIAAVGLQINVDNQWYNDSYGVGIEVMGKNGSAARLQLSDSTHWFTLNLKLDYQKKLMSGEIIETDDSGDKVDKVSFTAAKMRIDDDIGTKFDGLYFARRYRESSKGVWLRNLHIYTPANKRVSGTVMYWGTDDYVFNTCYLDDVLKLDKTYLWKIRLYDEGAAFVGQQPSANFAPYCKVGYGTIQQVTSVGNWLKLKVFPHTNISQFDVTLAGLNLANYSTGCSSDTKKYIKQTLFRTFSGLDQSLIYIGNNGFNRGLQGFYIRASSSLVKMEAYTFMNATGMYACAYTDEKFQKYLNAYYPDYSGSIDDCFDDYGNPTAGYVFIFTDTLKYYGLSADDFQAGDNYEILTDCIDSGFAYFTLADIPSLTVSVADDDTVYTGGSSADDPIVIDYCNIELEGTYTGVNGSAVSRYEYKVYDVTENSELLYSSGYIYGQEIECDFDRTYDEHIYRIVLNVTDTNGEVLSCERYFQCDFTYLYVANALAPKATYYPDHGSVIIDWSGYKALMPTISSGTTYEYSQFIPSYSSLSTGYQVLRFTYFGNVTYRLDKIPGNPVVAISFAADKTRAISTTDTYNVLATFRSPSMYVNVTANSPSLPSDGEEDTARIKVDLRYKIDDEWIQKIYTYRGRVAPPSKNAEWDDMDCLWSIAVGSGTCQLRRHGSAATIGNAQYEAIPLVGNVETNSKVSAPAVPSGYSTLQISSSYFVQWHGLIVTGDTANGDKAEELASDWNTWVWNDDTVLLANFRDTLNGTCESLEPRLQIMEDNDIQIGGYRVLKRFGESDKLYEIANFSDTDTTIIEDFAVGDNCQYTYFVYILYSKTEDGNLTGKRYVSDVTVSNTITLDEGVDKVFALTEVADNIYMADTTQLWRLSLNLDDTGFTLNNDKTWYDTLATYSQEYVGNRKYISKTISGLLGYISCTDGGDYKDTYDMLVSWNEFSASAGMKCFVDLRGLVIPGNFDSNPSVEYMDAPGNPATAKFTWRQKADLDIIKIYATPVPVNPTEELLFVSSDDYYFGVTDNSTTTVLSGLTDETEDDDE